MLRHIFPLSILVFFILACREDQEIVVNDPIIEVQFINADSLQKVNDSLTVVADSIIKASDSITVITDSLTSLADTVAILNDSIANGGTTLTEMRDSLLDVQANLTSYQTELEAISSSLTAQNLVLSTIANTINSGNLLVTSITNTDNSNSIVYSDSASNYNIPLSMVTNRTNLAVVINGITYLLAFVYERDQSVDEKRRVKIIASNVEIVLSGFDSVSCTSQNCENETPIKFYF